LKGFNNKADGNIYCGIALQHFGMGFFYREHKSSVGVMFVTVRSLNSVGSLALVKTEKFY
jgi:hypothetical protein